MDWLALENLYDEGRRHFSNGDYDEALQCFKRVYEESYQVQDVAGVVEDSYKLAPEQWAAKYFDRWEK